MSQLRNQVVHTQVKGIDRKNGIVVLSRRETVEERLTYHWPTWSRGIA